MKDKIIAWIKAYIRAYIIDRWFGGAYAKEKAKVKRQIDKVNALQKKEAIAKANKDKAQEDLDKTIDEMQSEEDF